MKILAIWDNKDDTRTKAVHSLKELKKIKHNGRKANKLIVHERDMVKVKLADVKKCVAYNGLIMQVGSQHKCLFDGRKKKA